MMMPAWSATTPGSTALAITAAAASAVAILSIAASSGEAFSFSAAADGSSPKCLQDKLRRAEERCKQLESEVAKLHAEAKHLKEQQQQAAITEQTTYDRSSTNTEQDHQYDETITIQQKNRKQRPPTIEDETQADGGIFLKRVGTIRSIYRLCVGTPRQGLLAPNARGYIELEKIGDSSLASSVIGLEEYSHIWIIFIFHLNTKSSNPKRIKSKISPPALGGKKVGLYATRSPHRYNPMGITLCKIDRIEKVKVNKNDEEKVIIHISGLDLVDGTPVLDIKPFVPTYDSVPMDNVKLPSWVEGGLATKRNVIVSQDAQNDLLEILQHNKDALQFYGHHGCEESSSVQETMDYVLDCISQVLAIDVRSNFQTRKAREGKFQAERAKRLQGTSSTTTAAAVTDVCTQQLDNLLITYTVDETSDAKRSSSVGSGAEDTVTVLSIKLLLEHD